MSVAPQTSGQSTTVVRLPVVVIVVLQPSTFFDVSAGEYSTTWLAGFSLGVVGVNAIYILCRLMSHRGDIYFFIIISAQEETAENMDYPESIFHKANYNADYRYGMERPIKVMDRQVISLEFVTNATSSDQSREEKRKKERERNSVLFFLSLFFLCAWFCL